MDINKIENKEEKIELAKKILNKIKDGQTIGAGSGTTVYLTIIEIGKMLEKNNWHITIIPASNEIENICKQYKNNIKIGNLLENEIEWGFDGADEVDENNNLLKGAGNALFREKINILNSHSTTYILADKTKFVKKLGEKHMLPIEIFPSATKYVYDQLDKIGIKDAVYKGITDNNNVMINVKFNDNVILNNELAEKIKLITGVIESGLFMNLNVKIVK